jgi:RNA polymerase sigma-70 factor (ECF subfamily)
VQDETTKELNVPGKLIDSADSEEGVIAVIEGLPDKGDMTRVAAAKNGNREAFEVLVARHERRILAVARRITRTREDAEDVTQQSFQKAFLHLHQFEGRASFSTWLTRVAINEAQMLRRKSRGIHEVSIDDADANEETAIALEVPDSRPDPEASCSQREWVGMLSSAMNELTPGMRQAIQLRELDERSMEETAQLMGISVNAVKARVFQGRRKLRRILQHYFGSPWASGRDTSRTIGNTAPVSQDQIACSACG